MSENTNGNNQEQVPNTTGENSTLRNAMSSMMEKNKEQTSIPAPPSTDALQKLAQTETTESQNPAITDFNQTQSDPQAIYDLSELTATEWFKSLPQEHKDMIRSGVNPDKVMDDLDKAVVNAQIESIREINRVRELEGKDAIDSEQYEKGTYLEDRVEAENDSSDDVEAFKALLRQAEGQDDAEDDEDAQERAMREIERKFENSIDTELIGADKVFDHTSTALRVTIKKNKAYEESVKNILTDSDIKFKTSKKKGTLKAAVLKGYTQRHNHVTTPLVNSGFHITLSGAAIPEIIAIASIPNPTSVLEMEMKKLSVIKKHLVDTSFGHVVNLQDLLKVIHHKDEQTLYYNLFISTFSEENDYPMTCANEKCRADLNLKVHSADLVLNADEFKDQINTILYENMDVKDVMKQTKLSKIKQVVLQDYSVVGIRIPSLYDKLMTMSMIEKWVREGQKDTTNLNQVFGYLMYIEYIALPTPDGEYIKFTAIDELIEILIGMEQETHNEIDAQVLEYDDAKEIEYGIKGYECPSCKRVHKPQRQKMDDLLFTLSQIKGMKNTLEQKKIQDAKKSSAVVK